MDSRDIFKKFAECWSAIGPCKNAKEWAQSYWCDFNDALCFNQVEKFGLNLTATERRLLDEAYAEGPKEDYGAIAEDWGKVKYFIAVRCGWDFHEKKCTDDEPTRAAHLVEWLTVSPKEDAMIRETFDCFAPSNFWAHPCGAGLYDLHSTWLPRKCVDCAPLMTPEVIGLTRAIWNDRLFSDMPILGDALEEAGCTNSDVLGHCRNHRWHGRGCWLLRHLRKQWGDFDGPKRPRTRRKN